MKILFYRFGGFSNVNSSLIEELRRRGHEVTEVDAFQAINPKASIVAGIINLFYSFVHYGKNWRLGYEQTPFGFKIMTRYCEKIGREIDFDIILQTQSLFGITSLYKEKPYFIYTDHTHALTVDANNRRPDKKTLIATRKWMELERSTYHKATQIFVMSNFIRRSLIRDYGVNESKVKVIVPGINVNSSDGKGKVYDGKTIIFVGIDFERKGGYVLLEAFKKVRQIIKDAKLVIVGTDLRTDDPQVVAKGKLPLQSVEEEYRKASLFVMPSFREPFGIVFLEAMAHRLPCIGSNIESIPEIIDDGKTGYIVEPGNSNILAEKIVSLLSNQDLMQNMGQNAKEKAAEFTWTKVVDKLLRCVMTV